jgi:hypothetical protein
VRDQDRAIAYRLTGDIDAAHARLRDVGVDLDPPVMRIGGPPPPMLWFRDPDGTQC